MSRVPQFTDFDAIIAAVQFTTLTWDFSPFLTQGQTLQGTPTLTLIVVAGIDATPAARITVAAQIGTAPGGRAGCAILAQVGNLPPGVQYKCLVSCAVTPNTISAADVVAGTNHFSSVPVSSNF